MTGRDEEEKNEVSSLPRRAVQRLVGDLRHDIQGAKQKSADTIPSLFILFLEKWLGFWMTLAGLTLTIGFAGMGLVYAAELGSTVPVLSNSVPWFFGYIWVVGVLIVLTYAAVLLSLLLVSVSRLVLWCRDTYLKFWNRDTPPFTTESSKEESKQWPPTDQQRKKALSHAKDYLTNGSVIFALIVFLLLWFEQLAAERLNQLLSSRFITIIGSSLDVGIGVIDFGSILGVAAPNASQPQLVLLVLFFVPPAVVMAIGTRNLLFFIEARVRDHIEEVRDGNLLGWSMAVLSSMFLYSLGIFANIVIQWT